MRRISLVFCCVLIMCVSCNSGGRGNSGGGSESPDNSGKGVMVKEYSVLALTPMNITVHNDFPASVEGEQVVEIRPMISGYIEEICVNEGQHVKRGQLLFRINNPQYEQAVVTARASVNSAQAEVNAAVIEVEKVRPLVEKDIVSSYRLESAELTLKTKEASLEQAKASLANAEANLAYTYIRSPQDGIIGTIPYKTGALVSSSITEPLTMLSDISNVFAYFSWNEKQLLDFLGQKPGSTIEEKIGESPPAELILANGTEYAGRGRIEIASGLITAGTGTATLKAVFANPSGIIRSGSSALVRIAEDHDSVLVVPQSATYELQDKRFVYVVNGDNTVYAKSFIATSSDDGRYYIVSDGLNSGDRIVTEGIISLKEGAQIMPRDTSSVAFYKELF